MKTREISVLYTNWKGIQRVRTITPKCIYFGKTKFHPEEQWLIQAEDEGGIMKDFAMRDCIFDWEDLV